MQTLTTRRWTQTVEHDHAKVERLAQGVALQDYSTVAQNDQVVYAGLILPSLPRDDGKCSYITPRMQKNDTRCYNTATQSQSIKHHNLALLFSKWCQQRDLRRTLQPSTLGCWVQNTS